jgi:hypothetical protein
LTSIRGTGRCVSVAGMRWYHFGESRRMADADFDDRLDRLDDNLARVRDEMDGFQKDLIEFRRDLMERFDSIDGRVDKINATLTGLVARMPDLPSA